MNEDFVCFEIANKLKENEFYCQYPFAMYNKYGQFCPLYSSEKYYFGIDDFDKHACIAPTISQVLTWLRKEKSLHITIDVDINDNFNFYFTICKRGEESWEVLKYGESYETYEEAALAGIEYVVKKLI